MPPRKGAGKGGGAAGGEARDMLVVFEAGITGAHVADVTDDEFVGAIAGALGVAASGVAMEVELDMDTVRKCRLTLSECTADEAERHRAALADARFALGSGEPIAVPAEGVAVGSVVGAPVVG